MAVSKAQRLVEFLRRLRWAAPASNADEAFELIARTLNAVEDELSGTPFDPEAWQADGRLYPPQIDSKRVVPGRPDVTRYRSRSHNTFVSKNGAIEIQTIDGVVLLSKVGADGEPVWSK